MAKKNLRFPAEWEKHKSTLLCWPHQKEDWPGKFAPIPWVFTEIIRNIIPGELVRLIVKSYTELSRVRKYFEKAHIDLAGVEFIISTTDRGWMRDISPAMVKEGDKTIAVKFGFNGWAKYPNWKKDAKIPGVLSKVLEIDLIDAIHKNRNIILEGGSIDINGKGTMVTTEECLLDQKVQVRNPGFGKKDYETVFRKNLGISNVIWLNKGIAGDDTHGHVDDLCRFVNDNTVVLCREENMQEENYKNLEENYERLQGAKLQDGSKVNVVSLPMPAPIYFEDLRLPASYANFYICNYAVLVPTFNDPNDRIALNILNELFPGRKVIGIYSGDLVWGLGTIHCLSHEEPV